ncbi:MAG: DUF447 family protein [Aeropyrum sp.]|nr:DUF447 family protein [Aeropyrum sp.]MCE4616544.1 DUF447 family protein [Aeropyrum sp.]
MLPSGVWLEFVALTCDIKYSMPLGVMRSGEEWLFRVYRGAGLLKHLQRHPDGSKIMLLSPSDPMAFLKSFYHELENEVEYEDSCPKPDTSLGSWYLCTAREIRSERHSVWFMCVGGLEEVASSTWIPYFRAYGCLVELLVLASKVKAGLPEYLSGRSLIYSEELFRCVRRSAAARGELVEGAERVLQDIRKAVGEA